MKSFVKDFKGIIKGLLFVENVQSGIIFFHLLEGIATGLLPFVGIYMSSLIITGISDGKSFNELLVYVAITVVSTLILSVLSLIGKQMLELKHESFRRKMGFLKSKKMSEIDYSLVEDPETHRMLRMIDEIDNLWAGVHKYANKLPLAISGAFSIAFALAITWQAFQPGDYSGDSAVLRFACSPASGIIILAIILIGVLTHMWSGKGVLKAGRTFTQKTRAFNSKIIYICQDYLLGYQAGKDVRVYKQIDMIGNELQTMTDNKNAINKDFSNSTIFYTSLNHLSGGVLNGAVYLYIGLKALAGLFDVGLVVRYIGGVFQFSKGLNDLLGAYAELKANLPMLQSYYEFFDLPSKMHEGTHPVDLSRSEHTIEFENVSFKYPGTEVYVTKNLSCTFEHGKRYAMVGMNGSGKTTMIKLLCRLYDPQQGRILLDGRDIREYDYEQYLDFFSVVFQDFRLFSMELGQNVAVGTEYDAEKVEDALNKGGFGERFKSMQNGLDTIIYKDFDKEGVEVSGGEAQKIAIARAVYKNAPFVVLDEPTAALDPLAEEEVYRKFDEIIDNKTAVYVSHRLSSCRFSDKILVMHQGEIVQTGTHEELLSQEGKYAEMWQSQSQYYVKK